MPLGSVSNMTEKGLLCSAGIILALFAVLSHGQPNTAPVILIPEGDTVNVGELETKNRLIYPFSITDAENDWFTCAFDIKDVHGKDKSHDEFSLTNTSRTSWQIAIAPGAAFDKDEVYKLEIECDDGDKKSEKIKLYVHVGQGQDIFWNHGVNVPGVDASTTKAGDVIYTLQATNTLNHPFGYIKTGESMSKRALAGPNGDYFFIDEATGDIIALQDLEHIPADISRANLNFYAIEEELKMWGSGRLRFINQNDRPKTTTLPLTQSEPESITSAKILFTLVIEDASYPGQTHTVKIDCTPPEWENLFELDGGFSFRLKPGKQLDYETGNRNYDCTFVINDGLHDSDTYQYSLTITDVNEPPKFSTSMYYVTINEGPNISYKHSKCQHCLKTFDGADAVVRHCVSDHPDKCISVLWPLLNDKCPGINDIGWGHQDARGRRKREGEERHGQRGEKMEEERERRRTKGEKREKRHNLHP